MLIAEINAVVEKYQKKAFTGHLKFGVEKSNIVSFTENSDCENTQFTNANWDRQLFEICTDLVYGSIEFDLILGKVERLKYCKSFNGELLKKKLGLINAEM